MGKEFEVQHEGPIEASPEQVFAAVTTGTGGWLWPVEYEPRAGGSEMGLGSESGGGVVTAWEPPRHFATRMEKGDWFNNLDMEIEPREGGSYLRYAHTGVFDEDQWDRLYDACRQHTVVYMQTLRQYAERFAGRTTFYAQVYGPDPSPEADGVERMRRALGLPEAVAPGDRVTVNPEGIEPFEAVVDVADPHFLGLSTDDAMYRVFGRDAWGDPVGLSLHLFAEDADGPAAERAWGDWLRRALA